MLVLGKVSSVLVGKSQPFANGSNSAINKKLVIERQYVSVLGLINDEQGDHRFHGGIEKAIHIYPKEHYQHWMNEIGNKPILQKEGAFGENISSVGLTEDTICLEDKIRIGTTILQVSQGRMPCWKLNIRFDQSDMALKLQSTLKTGWYFRVLVPGTIGQGDEIFLCERPYPDWPLTRIMDLIFSGSLNKADLNLLLKLPLVDSWKRLVEKRIESNCLEDWTFRLFGSKGAVNNAV